MIRLGFMPEIHLCKLIGSYSCLYTKFSNPLVCRADISHYLRELEYYNMRKSTNQIGLNPREIRLQESGILSGSENVLNTHL